MTAVAVVFWVAVGLLVYAQVGYPLLLELLGRTRRGRGIGDAPPAAGQLRPRRARLMTSSSSG